MNRAEYLDKLQGVLFKYFKDNKAAVQCVLAYYNMARTVRDAMDKESDRFILAQGVAKMAIDHTHGLPSNSFWQAFGPQLEPVWSAAFTAWLDAPRFMDMDEKVPDTDMMAKAESRVKVVAVLHSLHQIAVYAYRLVAKPEEFQKNSAKLLNELMDLDQEG